MLLKGAWYILYNFFLTPSVSDLANSFVLKHDNSILTPLTLRITLRLQHTSSSTAPTTVFCTNWFSVLQYFSCVNSNFQPMQLCLDNTQIIQKADLPGFITNLGVLKHHHYHQIIIKCCLHNDLRNVFINIVYSQNWFGDFCAE